MLTFRGLLESREKQGQTELYSAFTRMEKHAENSWLSLLGADSFSSYTGIPHIRGVERNVDEAVPAQIKEKFNSTEIFILLASILCHDVGKFLKSQDVNPALDESSHGQRSCMYILTKWPSLFIPREDLARGIAIVCCSHEWAMPIRNEDCCNNDRCSFKCIKTELSYLDNGLDSDDGYVRLRWLACLLRIADEVDNHLRRAVPIEFVVPNNSSEDSENKNQEKESWRRHITGIVFDVSGKCIRLRTPKFINSEWSDEEREWGRTGALKAIDKVLDDWKSLLNEIGLNFEQAFFDVSLPYPVLLPSTIKSKVNKIIFTPEPVLDDDIFDSVEMAIKRLSNAVIGKEDYFSWEALAEESHIPDVQLVRLAVNRLASLQKWPKLKRPRNRKEPLDIQVSDAGWQMSAPKKVPKIIIDPILESDRTIPSIEVLNDLLAPDIENQKERGFCARSTKSGEWLSPIIAIEGSSGDGKSTLSLQIANNLAKNDWFCLYYSLEQKSEQVLEILRGYNLFKNDEVGVGPINDQELEFCETFETKKWYEIDTGIKHLFLPRLTPRPVNDPNASSQSIFETRYEEIRQSLAYVCGKCEKGTPPKCFYILDSLTAFSNHPLSRSQIHRLFELFRQYRVPLLITLERQRHWVNNQDEDHFNIARYLADILINLDSQNTGGYFHQTIEVAKSRFSRRVLGTHLMKIKSTGQKSSGPFDTRTGIAIYPSIHMHLVNSRLDTAPKDDKKNQQFVGIDPNLLPICQSVEVNKKIVPGFLPGTCMVIHGAPGGHKFALAMNILMATRLSEDDYGQKLIISLAEENEIQLNGVALFENIKNAKDTKDSQNAIDIRNHLEKKISEEDEERGSKISIQNFGKDGCKKPTVTVLNFRLGNIMPEEFLYILDKFLKENEKDKVMNKIDTILFTDTVQLRTCFPLLHKEELFLPTLVDFIKSRKLTSIFIDVHDEAGHPNEALLAAADCRLYISKKASKIVCNEVEGQEQKKEKKQELLLNTIQVDNILGKSYDRNLRYVVAKQKKSDNHPVLYISENEEDAKKYWCEQKEDSDGC